MAQSYRSSFAYRNPGTYPGGALSAGLSRSSIQVNQSIVATSAQVSRSTVSKLDSTTGQVS